MELSSYQQPAVFCGRAGELKVFKEVLPWKVCSLSVLSIWAYIMLGYLGIVLRL